YRKVTRKIYVFSPEQEHNLLALVWVYREDQSRFRALWSGYLGRMIEEGFGCFQWEPDDEDPLHPLPDFERALAELHSLMQPFLETLSKEGPHAETLKELEKEQKLFASDSTAFHDDLEKLAKQWEQAPDSAAALKKLTEKSEPLAESSRGLVKQADLLYKLSARLIETCEGDCDAKANDLWPRSEINTARKQADATRQLAVESLKQVRYFWRQAHWLVERFPDAKLCDVEGLVKLVDKSELEANDWSLTPGRYVGVAPEEVDEDFDFEDALREIHVELNDLNSEAVELAARIKKNFEELGV
ncbi:MAG: SAM-dependent DNA methyltransferase, partial [Lacipirellulaceae bacterium]